MKQVKARETFLGEVIKYVTLSQSDKGRYTESEMKDV